MTMQLTAIGADPDRVIGYLSWWTLQKGEHDVQDIRDGATQSGVPQWIIERLKGRTQESAWLTATQLGASGVSIPSPIGKEDEIWRVVTRDYPNGDPATRSRALVVEVSRRNAASTSEVVSSRTAAIIHYDSGLSYHEMARWVDSLEDAGTLDSILQVLQGIDQHMRRINGLIDDGRIRSAVLGWLRLQHRVSVRGTGGVYFVPVSSDPSEQRFLENDLLSIRDWLSTIDSAFSVVALTKRGAFSIDDFVRDAVDEIKTELADIEERLDKWDTNPNMNSGSRAFSAGTQVERMKSLSDKINTLKDSLGEQVGVVDMMFTLLAERAVRMENQSSEIVETAKRERESAKAAKREAREKAKDTGSKKAGTSKERKSRRKL